MFRSLTISLSQIFLSKITVFFLNKLTPSKTKSQVIGESLRFIQVSVLTGRYVWYSFGRAMDVWSLRQDSGIDRLRFYRIYCIFTFRYKSHCPTISDCLSRFFIDIGAVNSTYILCLNGSVILTLIIILNKISYYKYKIQV